MTADMASHPRTATYQEYGFVQPISVDTPFLTWEVGAVSQLQGQHHNQR